MNRDDFTKQDYCIKKDGYILRSALLEDANEYYQNNFRPLNQEVAKKTGSRLSFTYAEVTSFFKSCIEDPTRYDFLLIDPQGHIIGESVINEIDEDVKSANFRIAIFHPQLHGKGIGTWMINQTLSFAFEKLHLHRISLGVFSFNKRAIHAYKKAGFCIEGILKDAIKNDHEYADDILMAILEDEWQLIKSSYPS